MVEVVLQGRSLIKTSNNSGPRTLPCGLPEKAGNHFENEPLHRNCCCLPEMNYLNHCQTKPVILYQEDSLVNSRSWGIALKALAKSKKKRKKTQNNRCSGYIHNFKHIELVTSSRCVMQDRVSMKPCCCGDKCYYQPKNKLF